MLPWLAQTRRRFPTRPALFCGGKAWSFDELADVVASRASGLADRGLGRGDRVGLVAENSLDSLLAIHAIFWRGATLVPFHPELGDDALAEQVDRVRPKLVLADSTHGDLVDGDGWLPVDAFAAERASVAPNSVPPETTATIIQTSGTTGTPKAVPLTYAHHRASAAASAFNLGIASDDRWLATLPLYHVGGLAIVLRSLLYGTAVDLRSGFDAEGVVEHLRAEPITLASFVPTMMRRILEVGESAPESLRAVLLGGGPVDAPLRETCRQRGYPVLPTWGMTETASQFTTVPLDPECRRPGTVGPPLSDAELRVVDAKGQRRETGETGRIQVRGPMVFDGYLDPSDEASKTFVDGWFETGDVGHLDPRGHLTIDTRASARIVTGGETVDPAEVASVLRRHPRVAEACIVGLADSEWGEVVAAAVESTGTPPTLEALREHCRSHLADFKCPRRWHIADRLPRTGANKLDREHIRARFDSDDSEE